MSVKKLLATILALAMVLTMASFPAFAAEAEQIAPAGVTSPHPVKDNGWNVCSWNGVIDGVDAATSWSNFFRANYTITPSGTLGTAPNLDNFNFTVDLGYEYNVTEFYSSWGSSYATGVALWASNSNADDAEWTLIADFTLEANKQTRAVTHDGYYRYILVEAYNTQNNDPACLEVKFKGVLSESVAIPEKITPVGVTSDFPHHSNYGSILAVIDGSEAGNSNFFRSSTQTASTGIPGDSRNLSFVVDLGAFYTIAKFYSSWGASYASGIALWGSADGVDFGTEPFATANLSSTSGMVEIDCDTSYRYIKVDAHTITGGSTPTNPACKEVAFYGFEDTSVQTVEYTVNYVDAEGEPLADAKTDSGIVGFDVTETAKNIAGYTVDEATKTITLVNGTNTITFVYTPRATASYTVNHVDTNGNPVADATTGTGYVGDSVTVKAVDLVRYTVDEDSKTFTIAEGGNTITFTYTLRDFSSPAGLVPSSVTSTFNPKQANTPLSGIIDGTFTTGHNMYFYSTDFGTTGDGTSVLGNFVFEFDCPVNLTEIYFQMGGSNHILNGTIYGSNDNSTWTPVHELVDLTWATASVGKANTQAISHEGYYKYFKIDVTKTSGTWLVWVESTFTGTPEPLAEEEPVTALGANIRLEGNGLSAGIRFGADIDKALAGIEGTYAYADDAEVKFGMFLLPEEMLGGATLTAYLEAQDDGIGDALDIVARNILSQDEDMIRYTAVLIDIPEDAWDQTIVAVPYMLVDGAYTYFEEKTQSYIGVAEDAINSYNSGNPNGITVDQYNDLLAIVG